MPEANESCPYQGLEPYSPQTAAYFFGREREQAIVSANLFASPLTVLYGRGGVGKSSLLGGGIIPRLASSPRTVPVYFRDWKQEAFLTALKQALANAVTGANPEITLDTAVPLNELVERAAREFNGAILVILDQFEDYLLHGAQTDTGKTFELELARTISLRDVDTGFLIAIRDDFLSQLQDRFKSRMPILRNTLRLRHIDTAAAERAIRQTLDVFNRLHRTGRTPVGIEDELVREIISRSEVGKLALSDSSGAGLPTNGAAPGIETSFLQLILTRVWEAETSDTLRAETLSELGGAAAIVRNLVTNAMNSLSEDKQKISAHMFRFLVMPSGTKIAQSPADLAAEANQPLSTVEPVLSELTRSRILTRTYPPERYEVFHDVFAPAVLDWRVEFQKAEDLKEVKQQAAKEARNARIFRSLALALGIMFLLAVAAGWVAHVRERQSRSRELAVASGSQLAADPERAIQLALYSLATRYTPEAEDALRRAVLASRVRGTLRTGDCATRQMSLSPDGARIAVACADGSLRVWEQSGQQVIRVAANPSDLRAVAFSPDGGRIATGGGDGVLRVWEASSGAPVVAIAGNGAAIESIAFTGDGSRVAAAMGSTAFLFNAASGAKVRDYPGHTAAIKSIAVSADGTSLATASMDGSLRLWDLDGGQPGTPVLRGKDPVWATAFSPDGRSIAAAIADRTIRRWDAGTGAELNVFNGHSKMPEAVAFSPDGMRLASAGDDGSARIWSLGTEPDSLTLAGHAGIVHSVVFGHNGKTVITASDDGTIRIWDAGPSAERMALRSPFAFTGVAFSPDGKLLIAGSTDSTIHVADAISGEEAKSLSGHDADVMQAVLSANGQRVASGSKDSTARIWNLPGRRELLVLPHRSTWVSSVAFTPDGKLLLTGGYDGRCRLWDAETGATLADFRAHDDIIHRVAFSSDGSRFASASADGTAIVWNTQTRSRVQTLGPGAAVRDLAFHPDGRRLVTASADKRLSIWDITSGQGLLTIAQDVFALAFDRQGALLATGDGEGNIRLWSTDSGKLLLTLGGSQRAVTGLDFTRDGRSLASSSEDGSIRVYTTNLLDLQSLARQRVTNPFSTGDCRQYLHTTKCPPAP